MNTKIKIFGERNTGTNYLVKLIKLNFKSSIINGTVPKDIDRVIRKLPYSEDIRDIYFQFTYHHNLGWKHKEINSLDISKFKKENQRIKFVLLVKNPYSWLLSLYHRPYHNYSHEQLSFDKFLLKNWITLRRETDRVEYKNPIEMWNLKVASYFLLQEKFDTYILKYEDMLLNPIEELIKLQKMLNLKTSADFPANFTKSTKDIDKDNNYYVEYYGNEKWKEKLTMTHIKIINSELDTKLMSSLNYNFIR
ncbi:sulfotransferase domain-containing protein [uncultured Draconibacterium sp.]|uniref:sulfotransferase domain-containing protein n=1 Tax=uncultured Draconibacterium sp. TaxID=1573823 RepID=UPI003217B687